MSFLGIDPGNLAAAQLAMVAATGAAAYGVMPPPEVMEEIEPDRYFAAAFDAAYGRFKATYPAIRPVQ